MGLEVDELTLSEDGSEITGRWQQQGQEIPLTFRRAGAE